MQSTNLYTDPPLINIRLVHTTLLIHHTYNSLQHRLCWGCGNIQSRSCGRVESVGPTSDRPGHSLSQQSSPGTIVLGESSYKLEQTNKTNTSYMYMYCSIMSCGYLFCTLHRNSNCITAKSRRGRRGRRMGSG